MIEVTTKCIEKTSLLTVFLFLVIQQSRKGNTKSLVQVVYLCINQVSDVLVFNKATCPLMHRYSSVPTTLGLNSVLVKVYWSRQLENPLVGEMQLLKQTSRKKVNWGLLPWSVHSLLQQLTLVHYRLIEFQE